MKEEIPTQNEQDMKKPCERGEVKVRSIKELNKIGILLVQNQIRNR